MLQSTLTDLPPRLEQRGSRRQRGWSTQLEVLVGPAYHRRRALLRDVSAGGAGLIVREEVAPGTILFVQLADRQGSKRTQLARVVHLTPLATGCWLLGCRWACPLNSGDRGRLPAERPGCSSPRSH